MNSRDAVNAVDVSIGGAVTAAPLAGCCGSMLAPLSDEVANDLAHMFTALSDPVRIKIVSLVASSNAGEICACDLIGPVGKSQPTISHHTKILVEAGLLSAQKRGRWVWYRIVPERLAALQNALA